MATATTIARCPDCKREIELWPLLQVGEELICPHCETDLIVVSLDPVELDWVYALPAEDDEEWEDWGDDWDDDWDDEDDDR
jgi:DNA-directed RNA polymerase subunit RPC12/RpoP